MSEVVRFEPRPPPGPAPAEAPLVPNPELIAGLEHLLELARAGTLTSMATALIYSDGTTDTTFDIAAEDDVTLMGGAVSLLSYNINAYQGADDE